MALFPVGGFVGGDCPFGIGHGACIPKCHNPIGVVRIAQCVQLDLAHGFRTIFGDL